MCIIDGASRVREFGGGGFRSRLGGLKIWWFSNLGRKVLRIDLSLGSLQLEAVMS